MWRAMFVMVMSVHKLKTVFHTETVSKDKIDINHCNLNNIDNSKNINNNNNNNNLIKNINCINNHLQLQLIPNNNNVSSSISSEKNKNCCTTIDKNIKRKILPISTAVDSSTILSPSALAVAAAEAQNSAQNSTNKFLLTELNNYRKKPPSTTTTTTVQVSDYTHTYTHIHHRITISRVNCLNKHDCIDMIRT